MDVKGSSGHRQRQAEATKREVARVARALFAEHGYVATTISAISAESDIPVQTIYSAFGSKAKILDKITELWMAASQTSSRAAAYLDEPDPAQQAADAGRAQPAADGGRLGRRGDLPRGGGVRPADGGDPAPGARVPRARDPQAGGGRGPGAEAGAHRAGGARHRPGAHPPRGLRDPGGRAWMERATLRGVARRRPRPASCSGLPDPHRRRTAASPAPHRQVPHCSGQHDPYLRENPS